jgi:hypothetical protein
MSRSRPSRLTAGPASIIPSSGEFGITSGWPSVLNVFGWVPDENQACDFLLVQLCKHARVQAAERMAHQDVRWHSLRARAERSAWTLAVAS